MERLEQILQEITAFETQLSRRSFIGAALLIAVVPSVSLGKDDQRFLDAVAATLIPATVLQSTGINVSQNVEHLLRSGSADHRRKVTRFLAWSQRASILYGGEKVLYQGSALGGSSMIFGAVAMKPKQFVFDEWREKSGVDITAETLEPHYQHVAEVMSVTSQTRDLENRPNAVVREMARALGKPEDLVLVNRYTSACAGWAFAISAVVLT